MPANDRTGKSEVTRGSASPIVSVGITNRRAERCDQIKLGRHGAWHGQRRQEVTWSDRKKLSGKHELRTP